MNISKIISSVFKNFIAEITAIACNFLCNNKKVIFLLKHIHVFLNKIISKNS